jgi:hypothetical protein
MTPMKLNLNEDHKALVAVRAAGDTRAEQYTAAAAASREIRAAILAATAAGATGADIANVGGITAQHVSAIITRSKTGAAQQCWEAAGRPGPAAALAAVAEVASGWRSARAALAAATDRVVAAMASAAGGETPVPASAIVAVSGLSGQAGYDYLAVLATQRQVSEVVDGLDLPVTVHLRRTGTRLEASLGVADLGAYGSLTSGQLSRRCASKVAAALAAAGIDIDEDALADDDEDTPRTGWATIRRTAD